MPSFLVVPFVIAIQGHLRVVDRIELIAIDYLSLQVGMERLDVGVVFRRGHMRELLVNAFFLQIFPDNLCDELGTLSLRMDIPSALYSSSISDSSTSTSPFLMWLLSK